MFYSGPCWDEDTAAQRAALAALHALAARDASELLGLLLLRTAAPPPSGAGSGATGTGSPLTAIPATAGAQAPGIAAPTPQSPEIQILRPGSDLRTARCESLVKVRCPGVDTVARRPRWHCVITFYHIQTIPARLSSDAYDF